ncbi:hypothetical protein AHAS_Ahas20G0032600 [Arachis hypogaea]
MMKFLLFDVDMVLRGVGYLWIDRFFSKGVDLYAPLIGKLGYKKVKMLRFFSLHCCRSLLQDDQLKACFFTSSLIQPGRI